MVTDRREYIRVDVGYFDNPKVGDALDFSPYAVLAHLASMAYARQHRTDGVVPLRRILRKVGASTDDAALLFDLGLWVDTGGDRIEVHDYAKHQETKEKIEARSAAARKANRVRHHGDQIPIGSEPDSESDREPDPDPESGFQKLGQQRRGEERRGSLPGGRPPLARSARGGTADVAGMLEAAGLPPKDHNDFLQSLRDHDIKRPPGFVMKAYHDGMLGARIQEWRDEVERNAKAPRVVEAKTSKAPRDETGRAVYEPELCEHGGVKGSCPMCKRKGAS